MLQLYIIMPHSCTTQMWPIVTDGLAWSVGLSVNIVSCKPCKNSRTDQDAIWGCGFKEACIRWGSTPPTRRSNFEGGKGGPLKSIGTTMCGGNEDFSQTTLTTCYYHYYYYNWTLYINITQETYSTISSFKKYLKSKQQNVTSHFSSISRTT